MGLDFQTQRKQLEKQEKAFFRRKVKIKMCGILLSIPYFLFFVKFFSELYETEKNLVPVFFPI